MAEPEATREVSNQEIKTLIIGLEKKLRTEIQKQIKQLECSFTDRLRRTDERIDRVEAGVEKKDGAMLELENKVKSIDTLKERIDEPEKRSEYSEFRSRKYNVLIYGIIVAQNENIMKVVRGFFLTKLALDETTVNNMII